MVLRHQESFVSGKLIQECLMVAVSDCLRPPSRPPPFHKKNGCQSYLHKPQNPLRFNRLAWKFQWKLLCEVTANMLLLQKLLDASNWS
jgi:hypothetical protein